MNVEEQLISSLLLTGDMEKVQKAGLEANQFLDPENRRAYEWLLTFKEKYSEVPTPEVFLVEFPDYEIVQADDISAPDDYLVDQLHTQYRRLVVEMAISAADTALGDDDIDGAIAAAAKIQAAAEIAKPSCNVNIIATRYDRLERYKLASTQDGLLGIPTGLDFLDAATLGLQPGQSIVITGLAKSCKTTLLLGLARAVWRAGKLPLVVSFEMPERQLSERLDGFWAGINPRRLQTGNLSEAEWAKLEATFLGFEDAHPFVVVEDRASAMTLSGLRAKVEQVKPDVLFIDGVYFLTDEISRETQTPIALTNISRGIKQLAMSASITTVSTTQALVGKSGRRGLGMYSGGYTSAWPQDADVLIGSEADEEVEGLYNVPILASRNSQPGNHRVLISWEPPDIKEIKDDEDSFPTF